MRDSEIDVIVKEIGVVCLLGNIHSLIAITDFRIPQLAGAAAANRQPIQRLVSFFSYQIINESSSFPAIASQING